MDTVRREAVSVGEGELRVTLAGEGPPVLLVHGFPDDGEVWRHQIPALAAAGFRVIVPDLRGCGDSFAPDRTEDYRLTRLVADLEALLDALGVDTVRLAGHDWGAVIAWRFAMACPQRVCCYAALSVGHPLAYATDGAMQKLKGWYALFFQWRGGAERLLRAGHWRLFRRLTGHPGEAARWISRLERPGRLRAALNYYRANLVDVLFRRDYPAVTMPVLGLWSSGDRFLTERQMLRSADFVSGGWRYRRIEGAGHWLPLDAPAAVNDLLIPFFRGENHVPS